MREIPFLEYLSSKLKDRTESVTLILPSRRVVRNLTALLQAKNNDCPIWLPKMQTMNEFVFNYSGFKPADPAELLIVLYESYKKIMSSAGMSFRSYGDFAEWGQMLLGDFHQIDSQLAPVKDVLTYIAEEKRISGSDLELNEESEIQNAYLSFYKQLYPIYEDFTRELTKKGIVYAGMAERRAVELVKDDESGLLASANFYMFAGFNALTGAEEELIRLLGKANRAEIYWDMDRYYVEDDTQQEAGLFFRRFKADEVLGKYIKEDHLFDGFGLGKQKTVCIQPSSQIVGQAEIAALYLKKWYKYEGFEGRTAVVLNDESLLIPLLNTLPNNMEYNLSIAVPLVGCRVHEWVELLLKTLLEVEDYAQLGQKVMSMDTLIKFWRNSLWQECISFSTSDVEKKLEQIFIGGNSLFDKQAWLLLFKEFGEKDEILWNLVSELIFSANNLHQGRNFMNVLRSVMEQLYEYIKDCSPEREFTIKMMSFLDREIELWRSYPNVSSDLIYRIKFIKKELSKIAVNYRGNSLAKIQITGMLETRMLDFDRVIMLSLNEGILPSSDMESTFLLNSVKRFCHIPTEKEKTAMQAYYFYRLLQYSKQTVCIYVQQEKKEKSRFLWQLEYEKPLEIISPINYPFPINRNGISKEISIKKDKAVIEKIEHLLENGISPSALNKYFYCGMQFYYNYILKISEKTEFDDGFGAAQKGSVVHKVLEYFFLPLKHKYLNLADVNSLRDKYSSLLDKAIKTDFSFVSFDTGKNAIEKRKIENMIHFFCDTFERELKLSPKLEKVVDCETKLSYKFVHEDINSKKDIYLKGIIDRVDICGGRFRVLDYKTGKAEERELRIKTVDDFRQKEHSKALQLAIYSYLYGVKLNSGERPKTLAQSGIYPLGILGMEPIFLNGDWVDLPQEQRIEELESFLVASINEILDPNIPFEQNTEACRNCAYKDLCGF